MLVLDGRQCRVFLLYIGEPMMVGLAWTLSLLCAFNAGATYQGWRALTTVDRVKAILLSVWFGFVALCTWWTATTAAVRCGSI